MLASTFTVVEVPEKNNTITNNSLRKYSKFINTCTVTCIQFLLWQSNIDSLNVHDYISNCPKLSYCLNKLENFHQRHLNLPDVSNLYIMTGLAGS